ncbi:hypothetical protein DDZ13_03915 [Coraliomargarita sinensis]|uniref:PpiC domain-containing protein n=1 Tax=Coraliomargarita sinensis TaxID=2174842 RepID=A0A317ZLR7_9BACT|nr:peptidyl-prolyl cis-trans isomerase [Coraliomargarita sinensis]PXA05117.1 hypothetical protein DDZ13_03915 [Coraliomargarita sinensis]
MTDATLARLMKACLKQMPVLGCAGAVCFFGGCSSEPEIEDPVAIEVGRRTITQSELQAKVDFMRERGSLAAGNSDEFIDRLVERSVALERAREMGLDQDMELRIQWENLLIGRLKKVEMDRALASVSVTDQEVEARYTEQLDSFTKPAQIRLALLYLEKGKVTDSEALIERMEKAKAAVAELPDDTRGFGALAMTYSEEATSRFKGGDIGWLQAGLPKYRWPEAVMNAAFALEPDELSDVIETEDGVYLLKKTDSRGAVVRPLDKYLQASLQRELLQQKKAELREQLERKWMESTELKLHPAVISEINFPTPSTTTN